MNDAATTTIRVSRQLYASIKELSEKRHENIQIILDEALKEYKRKIFYENVNSSFSRIKDKQNNTYQTDSSIWDSTLADDLEDDRW